MNQGKLEGRDSSLESELVALAIELAAEPPDPDEPSYRDAHPYATFRAGLGRPFSVTFVRGLQRELSGTWETERVARLMAATHGRKWSLTEADRILRHQRTTSAIKDIALDLLIHAYLQVMA